MSKVVQHWEDYGYRNTPTAGNAVLIQIVAEGVQEDDGSSTLHTSITTTNYAMFDNCVGGCKIGLLRDGNEVASYVVQSPRNPGRGFQPPTVRSATNVGPVPVGITFNQVAFKYANLDDGDNYTLPWDRIIEIGLTLLSSFLAA